MNCRRLVRCAIGGTVTGIVRLALGRTGGRPFCFFAGLLKAPMLHALSAPWIHHLIQAYGLWALFLVVMLESMGVPMPGETALVTNALYAGATHQIDIVSVVLVAAAAAVIGDNIGYLIGRWIGVRLLARYGRYIRLDEARLKVGQYLFLRHGGKIGFFR